MNKAILFAVGLGVLVFTNMPSQVNASTFVTDPSPVSVTEAEYQGLLTETCEQPVEGYCIPPFLTSLNGRVIQRVESHNQQYWINSGDGAPSVNPYFADGFYKTGKKENRKFYVVMDGVKREVKKGNTYKRTLAMISNGHARGISEADLTSLLLSCEMYDDDDLMAYRECVAEYETATGLWERISGTLVQRVEGDGALYYIPTGRDKNPVKLGRRTNGKSFYAFVKKNAQEVSAKTMRKMLPGRIF